LDSAGFARLLDALGGVNIYVENDLNYEDSYQNLYIHIKRGYQHMDGETAIKYVRFRSDELGDVGRVLRQQKFIQALADKLFSVGGLFKWPDIYSLWPKALETDVNWPGFLAMLRSFKRYNRESVRFEMLPGEFTTINGVSYWETDRGEVQILLGQLGIGYIK
jgi:anionic cell wall polymer biosynthesis LytR-Cps2A-Psr (LCP) family protein